MTELPQLNRQQLKEWREEILGASGNKFPVSFLFEQLFDERSPLSRGKLLSERVQILVRKFPNQNTYDGLRLIIPDTLKYLRDNDYIDEKLYHTEYDKCMKLLEI